MMFSLDINNDLAWFVEVFNKDTTTTDAERVVQPGVSEMKGSDSGKSSATELARQQLGIDSSKQNPPDWLDVLRAIETVEMVLRSDDPPESAIGVGCLVGQVVNRGHEKRAATWAIWRLGEWGCVCFDHLEYGLPVEALTNDELDVIVGTLHPAVFDRTKMTFDEQKRTIRREGVTLISATVTRTHLLGDWRRFAKLAAPNHHDVFESKMDGPLGEGQFRWDGTVYHITQSYECLEFLWDRESVKLWELGKAVHQNINVDRRTVQKALARLNGQLAELGVPREWRLTPRNDTILRTAP